MLGIFFFVAFFYIYYTLLVIVNDWQGKQIKFLRKRNRLRLIWWDMTIQMGFLFGFGLCCQQSFMCLFRAFANAFVVVLVLFH